MAKLQVVVCDECKSLDRPTKRYTLTGPQGRAVVDLCDQHARALEAILDKYATKVSRTPFEAKVTTVEEIEQRKKKPATN
ncbi:hypothetical protein [Cellulomonas sp. SG140]|uniref:hypothetical protein n=1 Tax=Cellulomonas sp. SG140 TaxID=2976536 RepID=UPI0021E936C0|nr:hypothetical protein [Cellulomonas sp. SG140]